MAIQLKRGLLTAIPDDYVLRDGQIGIAKSQPLNVSSTPFRFKIGDGSTSWVNLPYAAATPFDISTLVPQSRTINGKALTANITLTAADLGVDTALQSYVPNTRKINNHNLSGDINLTAEDVGAASASHTHTEYLAIDGTADSALKLFTPRTIQVDLSLSESSAFDGSQDVSLGVTNVLPVDRGGTGETTSEAALANLGGASLSYVQTNYLPLTGGAISGDLTILGDTTITDNTTDSGIEIKDGKVIIRTETLEIHTTDESENSFTVNGSQVATSDSAASNTILSVFPVIYNSTGSTSPSAGIQLEESDSVYFKMFAQWSDGTISDVTEQLTATQLNEIYHTWAVSETDFDTPTATIVSGSAGFRQINITGGAYGWLRSNPAVFTESDQGYLIDEILCKRFESLQVFIY